MIQAVPDPLSAFHPAIAEWFRRSLGEPTEVQARAWEAIRQGSHTLIAAPTGSGKTLAAFLTILNDLVTRGCEGGLERATTVLYVSPLKALSNDVEKNLSRPLKEIQDGIFQAHLKQVDIRVAVRTGDTTPGERAAMIKANPHILITTPESLYLLLTSRKGREMLRRVRRVIVDEIHALVGEKRGAHLSLSLERLQALVDRDDPGGPGLTRIGLSATQRPIEEVARFLTGNVPVTPAAAPGGPAAAPEDPRAPEARGPACAIIDAGHRRRMDIAVEIPDSPLTAVMAGEVWEEVYARIEGLIAAHRTTLLFVNTRRLAERVAHRLSQTLGEDKVAAHHGSLSKDRRFDAEQRLKGGSLRCLVATASLELGIDIGSVDLVIQIGNPKSISALLQRVGRSGHAVGALPKGRLFPLTLGELTESAALLDAVRRGELDRLAIPPKPLDILAQQMVAEVAAAQGDGREWSGADLFRLCKRAYPYRDLAEAEFREIADMLAQGFTTRRGRRGAYLHQDAINDRLRSRPGARLTALTNGGAIPDTFDYDVKLEPGNTLLGSVNEDFAIESIPGDIFQLGNNSWQIVRIEGSTVRVADAHGQPPTIPFWFGEAPGRSDAFSQSVSRLRREIADRIGETAFLQDRVEIEGSGPGAPWKREALGWLTAEVGLGEGAAEQLIDYLAAAKLSLGVMPTRETLVLERFFDDAGDMHMVLHAPFGSRINRAWGLSLRKRFCKKFNFELQAAATEDAIILSLGATHSFPLEEVFQYLRSSSVRHILIQALLDAPMFEVRWRWNATRALALLRNRNGKKVPAQLQRMAAEDLVALVFPDQRACFENIQGEREVPDHPLVRQTIADCLSEAMDIEGLESLLQKVEAGALRLEARDLKEPSSLAQEVIHARPYAFLDDAPLEERRTRAITTRRWHDPAEAGDLGRLDPQAIAAVRAEAWPQVRNADELHDALMLTGFLTDAEIETGLSEQMRKEGAAGSPPGRIAAADPAWTGSLETLKTHNRVAGLRAHAGAPLVWVAAERLPQALTAFPGAHLAWTPDLPNRPDLLRPLPAAPVDPTQADPAPAGLSFAPACGPGFPGTGSFATAPEAKDPDDPSGRSGEALVELLRGRLESLGPVRNRDLAESLGLPPDRSDFALLALEQEGFALRGRFSVAASGDLAVAGATATSLESVEWCERRLLARIHRYTLARLRKEIEPVSAAEYIRFLFAWQGITGDQPGGGTPLATGPEAVEAVLARLEGYEAPAAAWEKDILPARLEGYQPSWLDLQGLTGQYIWGRVRAPYGSVQAGPEGTLRKASLIKATPVAFLGSDNVALWLAAGARPEIGTEGGPAIPLDAEGSAAKVLAHMKSRGASFFREIQRDAQLSAAEAREGIAGLAAMGWLTSDGFRGLRALLGGATAAPAPGGDGLEKAGRWSLLRTGEESPAKPQHGWQGKDLEILARVLLRRYGVVFRKLADRENLAPPWRDLVRALRTLEARGEVRGGRFVEGFYGEQFALPEAVGLLRKLRKQAPSGELVSLSAADPANLQGLVTPGPRVPAQRKNRVLFRDGHPIAALEGGEFRILQAQADAPPQDLERALRHPPRRHRAETDSRSAASASAG